MLRALPRTQYVLCTSILLLLANWFVFHWNTSYDTVLMQYIVGGGNMVLRSWGGCQGSLHAKEASARLTSFTPGAKSLFISMITLFLKLRKEDLAWKKFFPLRNLSWMPPGTLKLSNTCSLSSCTSKPVHPSLCQEQGRLRWDESSKY